MQTAKLFMNGRSQAVRLPKDFQFSGEDVLIQKYGDAVILLPHKKKAISKKLIIITNNIKEFKQVDGLLLENWVI